VWFVAEYPSLTQVERAPFSTPEAQWNISIGDRLFREMLAKHGFKTGGEAASGGWRCYITDIVKSTYRATKWNAAARDELFAIAEAWSPVLAWELETGRPAILVVLGNRTKTLLDHLLKRRLVPHPRTVMSAWSYAYVASRPDSARKLGPMHPVRLAEYDQQFAAIAQRRDEIATTALVPEPQIAVRFSCEDCDGRGRKPDSQGMTRPGGGDPTCKACRGSGFVKRWLPISGFKSLLGPP
jgi:hypothetical protein